MKRVFNKQKCIRDLIAMDPHLYGISKKWIDICDGKEVINGIVTGDHGEEYCVSLDWTDVIDEDVKKKTKKVFSRDLYIEDMDKCVPQIKHAETSWAIDCDGAEVINGHAAGKNGIYTIADEWTKMVPVEEPAYKEIFSRDQFIQDMGRSKGESKWVIDCDGAEVINGMATGKSGRKYCINDDWIKKVPVEEQKTPVTDDCLREDKVEEPKKEVKKTKYFFSKEAYLATGEKYFKWIDDCDGAEVLNGMAIGKSGTEYYMLPEWLKTVPAEEKPATKKIFSKDKYLKKGGCYYHWIDDCDGAEVIGGIAIGKSGKTYYMSPDWTVEVPAKANLYRIEIKCSDNKTTTATLYMDNKKVKDATARCSDEDTFDLFRGATLALDRLLL